MDCKNFTAGLTCTILTLIASARCDAPLVEVMSSIYHRGLDWNATNGNTSSLQRYPRVETTSGIVVGISTDLAHAFYEIPYAEAPIGNLRFQDPLPLNTPLRKINATLSTYLRCIQYTNSCSGALDDPCPANADEDCLVLSIFVPARVKLTSDDPPLEKLPVMFYIHGGNYKINAGTDSRTNGEELCDTVNAIVVVTNYRLGALGFLSHIEKGKPDIVGNQGMKDQRLALQWVQDNIENFGGDKTRVMLFGNSAGAQSTMFHSLWEKSKDLFSNSIQQSNPHIFSLHYSDFEESLIISETLVEAVGCKGAESERQCLLELPAQNIMDQMAFVEEEMRKYFGNDLLNLEETFTPIIDGIEFTDQPVNLYRDGKWQKDKPVIIGINTEETDDRRFSHPPNEKFDKNDFIQAVVDVFGYEIGTTVAEKYIAAYPPEKGENYRSTYYKIISHYGYDCPSRLIARYAANTTTSSVYYYINSHQILIDECVQQNGGNKTGCYFSSHASEIRYVFRTVNESSEDYTESDRIVENEFSTYWGSFARTGDPSNGIEKDLGMFPDWPIYTANGTNGHATPWLYMYIEAPTSRVDSGHEEELCDFWDEINYGLTGGTRSIHDTSWGIAISFAVMLVQKHIMQ